jgi:tripartite ATP-independent transporter DctP family solute receptor
MLTSLTRRAALALASASVLATRNARSAERPLRIANNQGKNTPYGVGCRAFAQAINADPILSGLLRPDIYDDAELGEEQSSLRSCMRGTIEIACVSSGILGTVLPLIGLLDLPFLFRDAATARAMLDGEIGIELTNQLATKGINIIAWGENGVRQMTANKPIRQPADMVGLKLRVPNIEAEILGFRGLGAEPRPLAFTLLYEALRTGEFDAQENPVANIEAGRLYEVQKYLSRTGHIYSAAVFLASADLLSDLTDEQRAALRRCARVGALASRDFAQNAEHEGLARLRAKGMTIIEDVDLAAFIAAAKPNLLEIGKKLAPDLMARLIQAGG